MPRAFRNIVLSLLLASMLHQPAEVLAQGLEFPWRRSGASCEEIEKGVSDYLDDLASRSNQYSYESSEQDSASAESSGNGEKHLSDCFS